MNQIHNSKGQSTLEAVLLAAIGIGAMLLATRALRQMGYAQSLIQNPWSVVAGMAESGVWKPAAQARKYHPNIKSRNLSYYGDLKSK